MALFIFISGFFCKTNIRSFKDLLQYLKKKVIPLLTNFFFHVGFLSSDIFYGDKIIFPISSLKQFLTSIIKIIILMGREPFCGAFWFIVSLIFINVMYAVIIYISNRQKLFSSEKVQFCLVLITFMCGCLMNKFNLNIPRFSPAFTLMLPYYVGNLIGQKKFNVSFDNKFFFLLSITNLFYLSNKGTVAMNSNTFTSITFLILNMIYGIYTILFISKKIDLYLPKISKSLQFVGRNTLAIMGWHYLGFKTITLIQLLFGVIQYNELAILGAVNASYNSIWYYLYIVGGVLIPLMLHYMMQKVFKIKAY